MPEDNIPHVMVGDTKVPLRPPTAEPVATTLARLLKPIQDQLKRIEDKLNAKADAPAKPAK